jgi:oxygen-independent coproporphyrinogen-3 oxidase
MNYSLYVHIPFCKHRCHYCDFNTYADKESLIPGYIDALIEEIRIVNAYLPNIILHSIYFGGGTPSLISISDYQKLFAFINTHFLISGDCEISLEANLGTISLPYLTGLRSIGFNRVSFGVQSTNSIDLPRLDRIHSVSDILDAMRWAKRAGFENINWDMIFNFPWQDLSSWQRSLSRALDLQPQHFSLYSLIIEPGTPFHNWYQRGLIAPQDSDLEADMYEFAIEALENAGYFHYEISNWAKSDPVNDFRCRHNLQYWLNQPYIGIGAGSHGYLGNIRTENVLEIEQYIDHMSAVSSFSGHFPETPATISTLEVDRDTQMRDFMWLGLRLVREGVSMERFRHTFGCSARDVFGTEIGELLGLGLVEWGGFDQSNLRLTRKGILLANQVFLRFI